MNSKTEELAISSLTKNGMIVQVNKLLEEMHELSIELHALLNDNNCDMDRIASEMADVIVAMEPVKIYCNRTTNGRFVDILEVELNYKISRQEVRIKHQI